MTNYCVSKHFLFIDKSLFKKKKSLILMLLSMLTGKRLQSFTSPSGVCGLWSGNFMTPVTVHRANGSWEELRRSATVRKGEAAKKQKF